MEQYNYSNKLSHPIFSVISDVSARLNVQSFVIGGYVRDIILNRNSNDIDIMTIGSGIELAISVNNALGDGGIVEQYGNFGTAMLYYKGEKFEFAGARKESYSPQSRKPSVENGTLEDDQNRRDFTINAMAISLNKDTYGELIDPFYGLDDLYDNIIQTPLDPDITFSDDPLRMFRAVRFASQLYFDIAEDTFASIQRNINRVAILSGERISEELNKIILSPTPSYGFSLLKESGLLQAVLPEIYNLQGVDKIGAHGHKDVYKHTLEVLDNVAKRSDNLWLRWAALLHDVAKPQTKKFDAIVGWSFHNHETIGAKMVEKIFARLKLPQNEKMLYVQKIVKLHLRPIALVEETTDSAVRRLLFEAGDDIDDLMLLCRADVTSKNPDKIKMYAENFNIVEQKLVEIEEKDKIRNFKLPVDGTDIMKMFNLPPCRLVGTIREALKDAILDGVIVNSRDAAIDFINEHFAEYKDSNE